MSILSNILQPITKNVLTGVLGEDAFFALISNGQLSPLVTFTRSTTQTYFDSNGVMQSAAVNEPAIDHVNGRPALALYDASTNLALQSRNMNAVSGGWDKGASLTYNGATTLGGLPAFQYTSNATSNSYLRRTILGLTVGQTYTWSFLCNLATNPSTGAYTTRIVTTAHTSSSSGLVIEKIADGLYLWSETFVPSLANVAVLTITDAPNGTSFTVTEGQVEAKPFRTPAVPTTVTSATRAVSVAKITGDDFNSFYNKNEGTFVVNWTDRKDIYPTGYAPTLFEVNDGTVNNRLTIGRSANTYNREVRVINSAGDDAVISLANKSYKGKQCDVLTYKDGEVRYYLNGDLQATDTTVTPPQSVDRMAIGGSAVTYGTNVINNPLHKLTYYPRALSNREAARASAENFDFHLDGDSYVAGAGGIGIKASLEAMGYLVYSKAVGGSTLAQAETRIRSNPVTGLKPLIFCDGSVNSHGTIAQDLARLQAVYDACGGNVVFISPCLYANLAGQTDGQYTLDLTAAMITQFGADKVVDLTAVARTLSGVTFTNPASASDAGYANAAYDALFQADNVHMGLSLSNAAANAALEKL